MMLITTAPTGGLRPLAATGAEGLKQPSKGSPPLMSINMFLTIFFCDHTGWFYYFPPQKSLSVKLKLVIWSMGQPH